VRTMRHGDARVLCLPYRVAVVLSLRRLRGCVDPHKARPPSPSSVSLRHLTGSFSPSRIHHCRRDKAASATARADVPYGRRGFAWNWRPPRSAHPFTGATWTNRPQFDKPCGRKRLGGRTRLPPDNTRRFRSSRSASGSMGRDLSLATSGEGNGWVGRVPQQFSTGPCPTGEARPRRE
jgi:hypothetical protein